jgi:hypothetical protein
MSDEADAVQPRVAGLNEHEHVTSASYTGRNERTIENGEKRAVLRCSVRLTISANETIKTQRNCQLGAGRSELYAELEDYIGDALGGYTSAYNAETRSFTVRFVYDRSEERIVA